MIVKQYPEIVQKAILQEHIKFLSRLDYEKIGEEEPLYLPTLESIANNSVGGLFSLLSRHSIRQTFNQDNKDKYFWIQLLKGNVQDAVKLVEEFFIFDTPQFESITVGKETFNI